MYGRDEIVITLISSRFFSIKKSFRMLCCIFEELFVSFSARNVPLSAKDIELWLYFAIIRASKFIEHINVQYEGCKYIL